MEHISVAIEDGVAVVTLDRPPVNALANQTFGEITAVMQQLSAGRDASAIVLRAAPDARLFCGGVDLQDSPRRHRPDGRPEDGAPKGDARDQVDPGRSPRDCFNAIYDCGLPVIAEVHGKCIGAGVAVVASCDLVVASTDASFALTEINVGVLGGVRHAQRLCGPWLAKRMFLTGQFVTADEIYRRGGIVIEWFGDDRFTDLDDVVAHPGHPASAADRRVFEATVLQHPEPDECDERVAGAFVVGHHRSGVEAPANTVCTRRHAGVSLTCWAPRTWHRSSSRAAY
jgi:enoyl-CoA hydratase/carnithine racemase